MKYKLKHLSKYCCKPATETEFEAVKMAAELGGIRLYDGNEFNFFCVSSECLTVCPIDKWLIAVVKSSETEIPVLDFIKKLRMTEEEAKQLEDDRVRWLIEEKAHHWVWSDNDKVIKAINDHYFRVSEDGLTVTLHKKEVK